VTGRHRRTTLTDADLLTFRYAQRQLTPLRQSVLTKRPDQTAPVSASPTITSFSSSLAQSMSTPNLSQIVRAQSAESAVRLSPVTGRPLAGKTPRHYAGPGMSSQPGVATPSRFGAAGGSRAGTPSWGPAQSTPGGCDPLPAILRRAIDALHL
jgi:hypothetical protein